MRGLVTVITRQDSPGVRERQVERRSECSATLATGGLAVEQRAC